MQTFFAIIKTESDLDYVVTLITRETLLMLVEQELGAEIRKDCDEDPAGVYGKTLNYLSTVCPLIRLYEYTLAGARVFLAGAHGVGPVYELRAVELVRQMRDYLTRDIDQAVDNVRGDIIQKVIDTMNPESRMGRVREVMESDPKDLMQYLTR